MGPQLVGGFNHLEKYESRWEGLSHILWKIKNVCVVTEIPLHFFVTPFSFFQMELEAEALHGP